MMSLEWIMKDGEYSHMSGSFQLGSPYTSLIIGVKTWKQKMLLLSDDHDPTFQANLIVDIDYHKDNLDFLDR